MTSLGRPKHMQLSDDGQWMWNGTDWVPAPQQAMAPPIPNPTPIHVGMAGSTPGMAPMGMTAMNQPQQVVIMQEKGSKKIVPWVGVGLILISLFMPYVSVMGFFEVSGFEIIGYVGEVFEAVGDDSGDDSLGDGGGDIDDEDDFSLGAEGWALVVAAILFVLSPLFFLITSITSSIILLMGKSPRIVGIVHLAYVAIFMVAALASPSLEGFSIFSIIGFGFYMGAFSSGALLAK